MEKTCPHESCVHSSLQGLSNGLAYGAKVRFTHSLVMSLLFSKEPLKLQLLKILKNTQEHSGKLGFFVMFFKSFVCALSKIRGKKASNHAISGFFTGFIWAKDTPVNTQITFYLFSRNLVGYVKLFHKKKLFSVPAWLENNSFCILTVVCWGIVMYLFEAFPNSLQSSLVSSMKFLYKDSDNWNGWGNCVPYYNQALKLLELIY